MASQSQQKTFMHTLIYYLLWSRIWFWDVPAVFARRWIRRTTIPLLDDVIRTVFRQFFHLANYAQLRRFYGLPEANATKFLGSKRFSPYSEQLYQKVSTEKFTGYWIIQGELEKAQNPADSDVVIVYYHGGGYVGFSVSNSLVLALGLWESIKALKPNARVSIFALEYDLAPELQFPGQLQQAAAAYDYLIAEMGIDPKKIILSGNSAGGHLALSLLMHLNVPYPSILSSIREKPLGAILITPWLDIFPTKPIVTPGAPLTDVLDDAVGTYWANGFHSSPLDPSNEYEMMHLRPLQCSLPWKEILPARCTVTSGTDDLLCTNCIVLRDQAKQNGRDIELLVEPNQFHDWQWGEASNDPFYLSTTRNKTPEYNFKGTKQLARVVVNMIESE